MLRRTKGLASADRRHRLSSAGASHLPFLGRFLPKLGGAFGCRPFFVVLTSASSAPTPNSSATAPAVPPVPAAPARWRQLIEDAQAALARREKRHVPSWWARSGQRPGPKENEVWR